MTGQDGAAQTRPSSVRRWLISGVMVGLVAAMAAYVVRDQSDLGSLRRLSSPLLTGTLLVQFLSQLAFNGAMLIPLQISAKTLGFWEFFLVRTGGFLLGSLVPVAGGIAVRLAYLRRRGVTVAHFTWATLLSNVLALAASAALAVVATAVLWSVAGKPPALALALSAGVLLLSVAALAGLGLVPRLASHAWLTHRAWMPGVDELTVDRQTTVSVFALSLLRHGLNFVTFGWLYQSLSQTPGGFLAGGLVYALTSPIRMITITPGNLGINEWAAAIAGTALDFDVATGLLVALLFRAIAFLAQGVGVLVGWVWLTFWSTARQP